MIEAMEGTLLGWDESGLLLRVGPVDIRLLCPVGMEAGLSRGQTIRVRTLLEPGPQGIGIVAYGFGTEAERRLFQLLKEIQMVGPRVALGLLAIPIATILRAVAEGDEGVFKEVKGVGPKLARRILSELADSERLQALGIAPAAARAPAREAQEALEALGFTRQDAVARLKGLAED
ncbi:hypothetical protein IIA16_03720, partial [bacterium]|nr:hypothetical protein [bacterium]